jgi:hypothetical protein
MTQKRWMMVIPPDGAARNVAHLAAKAFSEIIPDSFKIFDTLSYLKAYRQLLKNPEDELLVDLCNQSLVTSAIDFGTTHLLSGALSPVTLFTLNILKKINITTLHWFYEDYNRARYWQDILAGYDHFFAVQKGILPKICKEQNIQYHFLPTAQTVKPAIVHQNPGRYDIGFIGIPSTYRISILEKLHVSGFKCLIAGYGWNQYSGILDTSIVNREWVDDQQIAAYLSQVAIGINLSFENPFTREDSQVSPRVYDILSSGAVLLTENLDLLEETVAECHYETFINPDDAVVKAKLIRSSLQRYQELSAPNCAIIQAKHTFHNRIEQILSAID